MCPRIRVQQGRPFVETSVRTVGLLVAVVVALLAVGGPAAAAVDPERRDLVLRGVAADGPDDASSAVPTANGPTADGPTAAEGPLTDPYRDQQWYLDRIGLDGSGPVPDGTGQVVAIIDSGVDLAHPDLVDALVRDDEGAVVGRDFVDDDEVPQDAFGHGTMVAGVVAARSGNGLGIAGVAGAGAGAQILPVRVLDETGRAPASRVAEGVDWAVAAGATVLNLSLETAGVTALRDDPALDRAIDRALAAGLVVVVAAGNGDEVVDPGRADGVVVVGATDPGDRRAGFSDRGRTDLLMAPGTGIVSTWCRADDPDVAPCDGTTHTYGIADGTSFAAPQVSGLVALLASTGLAPVDAARRLAATTVDLAEVGPDTSTGRGRVQLRAALGAWPDRPVPRTTPADLPAPAATAATPRDAEPVAVVGARPPAQGGLGTRAVVVVAILAAVAAVVRGLVAGASSRARSARDTLR